MAKRTRGSSRPGRRPPLQRSARTQRSAASTPTSTRPATLTPEEEARAAELEAQIVAEERQAEQTQQRARERQRSGDRQSAARSSMPLAAREAEEYAYVARDVRRIALIASGIFVILFGLWIAFQVTGVGAI